MFGRVRASPSLDSFETPSKIIKDDSLSIYEITLIKLKLGSQRHLMKCNLMLNRWLSIQIVLLVVTTMDDIPAHMFIVRMFTANPSRGIRGTGNRVKQRLTFLFEPARSPLIVPGDW
ncbi:hypothetical protein V6N13_060928 [Hibiscus sabdariffa]|uniref:Uncharacterized protein n=2 Tax=Hibiscus sabdariffa TaxID=183260 RepID=A0ABR2A855_9ROSI